MTEKKEDPLTEGPLLGVCVCRNCRVLNICEVEFGVPNPKFWLDREVIYVWQKEDTPE